MNSMRADGKVHKLDDQWYYILKILDEELEISDNSNKLSEYYNEFVDTYCNFLFEKHPDTAIRILKQLIKKQNNIRHSTEDIQFICNPAEKLHDPVSSFGTFGMKFKLPTGVPE
jgi:hypothetical protein